MRVRNKASLLPFQNGILVSTNALSLLYEELKNTYGISYLLTYRLNQDVLELFFGIMRSMGGLHDHPTPLEFKYRIRNFLLSRNKSIVSQSANVSQFDDPSEEVNIAV